MENSGPISENDLMHKLVNAKKIMNKVDSGNYQKGNIDKNKILSENDDSDVYEHGLNDTSGMFPPKQNSQIPLVNEERINQSKLPQAIKDIMIQKPIPQVSLGGNKFEMSFMDGAKKLMEREGLTNKKTQPINEQRNNQPKPQSTNLDYNILIPLIETVIRKVFDEKINEMKDSQGGLAINENLAIRVGESIFKGKITKVTSATAK